MKTRERKIYNSKNFFLATVSGLVFLFIGLAGVCSASTNNSVSGTLFVSPKTVHIGEPITISIKGQDNEGLIRLEAYYQDSWHRENVSGTSVIKKWTITEDLPGTYRYQGRAVGISLHSSGPWADWLGWSFKSTESASTSPEYIDVIVLDPMCDGTSCEIGSPEYCQSCEHCGDDICNCEENNDICPEDCKTASNDQELEKSQAAAGLTLKSFLKKWYTWLLLGILAILLLYWLFRKPGE
jgi:hypothetical protein